MEHPCRQIGVISDVGAEDHGKYRDASEDVYGYDSFGWCSCHDCGLFFDYLAVNSSETVCRADFNDFGVLGNVCSEHVLGRGSVNP